MPGLMIHLIVAHKLNPNGSALFFLGSLAPDAVPDWREKEVSHFRNLPDREPALISLAMQTDGEYAEGALLHLFTDWKWDLRVRRKYMDEMGENWHPSYRSEISSSGSYAFHSTNWAKQCWHDMDAVDIGSYGVVPGVTPDNVKALVSREGKWHNENSKGPSTAFPPELIEDFAEQVVREYVEWKEAVKRKAKPLSKEQA